MIELRALEMTLQVKIQRPKDSVGCEKTKIKKIKLSVFHTVQCLTV